MEKITREQFNQLKYRPNRMANLMAEVNDLKIGEGIHYLKEEFDETGLKTPFSSLFHQTFRVARTPKKFRVSSTSNRDGWVIIRLK